MTNYVPRSGSAAERAIACLQKRGELSYAELAEEIGARVTNLGANLAAAVRGGALERCFVGGRPGYKIGSGAPEVDASADEPAPFNAAIWLDGDVLLSGVQVNPDGSVLLLQDQVQKLMKFLALTSPTTPE